MDRMAKLKEKLSESYPIDCIIVTDVSHSVYKITIDQDEFGTENPRVAEFGVSNLGTIAVCREHTSADSHDLGEEDINQTWLERNFPRMNDENWVYIPFNLREGPYGVFEFVHCRDWPKKPVLAKKLEPKDDEEDEYAFNDDFYDGVIYTSKEDWEKYTVQAKTPDPNWRKKVEDYLIQELHLYNRYLSGEAVELRVKRWYPCSAYPTTEIDTENSHEWITSEDGSLYSGLDPESPEEIADTISECINTSDWHFYDPQKDSVEKILSFTETKTVDCPICGEKDAVKGYVDQLGHHYVGHCQTKGCATIITSTL